MTASYNNVLSTVFSKGVRNSIQEEKADVEIIIFSDMTEKRQKNYFSHISRLNREIIFQCGTDWQNLASWDNKIQYGKDIVANFINKEIDFVRSNLKIDH